MGVHVFVLACRYGMVTIGSAVGVVHCIVRAYCHVFVRVLDTYSNAVDIQLFTCCQIRLFLAFDVICIQTRPTARET